MHEGKKSSSDDKEYHPGSFKARLKERKIIATLAAFIGGGWLTYEVVHWILVDHYHLPKLLKDITIVTFLGALLSTVIWRWFKGAEKRPGNVKVEVLVVPLIILLTVVIDLKLIFSMTGLSINMLLIGMVVLCLGIAWVIFKSLQWAASVPEAEKRVEVLEPVKEKPISFPEWKKSIAVLPFNNISPEEGQDYFCDGMTEEIITDLSSIRDLRVISRGSAMTLKGSKKKAKEIAKEVNVQYVLEGSVRKAGNNLRITAQLIDATTDAHLWAEKYSGTLDDVFDVQEKVSRSIVDELKLKLSAEEKQSITERPFKNVKAYDCYLRAKHEIDTYTEEGLDRAIQHLESGIEIIGENALLYAGLGYAYWQYFNIGMQEKYLNKGLEYARKALELDPDSSEGHFVTGNLYFFHGTPRNFKKIIFHLKRALKLDPNNCEALWYLEVAYLFLGKMAAVASLVEKNLSIDPLSYGGYWSSSILHLFEGRPSQALAPMAQGYQLAPGVPPMELFYALILAYNDRLEDAFSIIDQSQKITPDSIFTQVGVFLKYALQRKREETLQSITPRILKWGRIDFFNPWLMVMGYSLIGETEEALNWLEEWIGLGCINYPFINEHDPFLENIRSEPRFKKLMERVKHEWENFEV